MALYVIKSQQQINSSEGIDNRYMQGIPLAFSHRVGEQPRVQLDTEFDFRKLYLHVRKVQQKYKQLQPSNNPPGSIIITKMGDEWAVLILDAQVEEIKSKYQDFDREVFNNMRGYPYNRGPRRNF